METPKTSFFQGGEVLVEPVPLQRSGENDQPAAPAENAQPTKNAQPGTAAIHN